MRTHTHTQSVGNKMERVIKTTTFSYYKTSNEGEKKCMNDIENDDDDDDDDDAHSRSRNAIGKVDALKQDGKSHIICK